MQLLGHTGQCLCSYNKYLVLGSLEFVEGRYSGWISLFNNFLQSCDFLAPELARGGALENHAPTMIAAIGPETEGQFWTPSHSLCHPGPFLTWEGQEQ